MKKLSLDYIKVIARHTRRMIPKPSFNSRQEPLNDRNLKFWGKRAKCGYYITSTNDRIICTYNIEIMLKRDISLKHANLL